MSSESVNYFSSLKERMANMLISGSMADCEFHFPNDVKISAHKNILANASPVFHAMFFGELRENGPVKIENMEPELFRKLLLYIYSEQLELNSIENACLLYDAGEMYNLPQLKKNCENYIASSLTVSDVCFVYGFLKLHNNIVIENKYLNIIKTSTNSIFNCKDFVDCDVGFLKQIAEQPVLSIVSEIELFNAVEKWSRRKVEVQGVCLSKISSSVSDVLCKIRFLTMTSTEFAGGPGLSQLLSAEDKLSLILNILKPGICEVPEKFCQFRQKRTG